MIGFVEIVAGTLGGGKSMYAVEEMYGHLVKGGWCATNIEMKPEAIGRCMAERDLRRFDPDRLKVLDAATIADFPRHIPRGTSKREVLVVVDESHLEWNSRDYQATRKDEKTNAMLNFITLVRKLDIRLIFVTQSAEDIDKQMRKKADRLTMCRNLRKLRILGIVPCPLPLFLRNSYSISIGHAKPISQGAVALFRPKWVCELYNSDALLGKFADTFRGMQTVEATPLEALPPGEAWKFRADARWVTLGAVCGGLFF